MKAVDIKKEVYEKFSYAPCPIRLRALASALSDRVDLISLKASI